MDELGREEGAMLFEGSVLIHPGQKTDFLKKLSSLSKKAVSFNLDPIEILSEKEVIYQRVLENVGHDGDTIRSSLVPVKPGTEVENPIALCRIKLKYPVVKLGEWEAVGKLESMGEDSLVYVFSGNPADEKEILSRSHQPSNCEHCNKKRNRYESFLLRNNQSGEYKQVGGTCLEDFTGIDPAKALFLAKLCTFVRMVEGEREGFCSQPNVLSLREFLACVNYITETSGFVSASKSRETGCIRTSDEAYIMMREGYANDFRESRDRHLERADEVIAWFSQKEEVDSSFEHNLKLLLSKEYLSISPKEMAFVAASIPMWNRAKDLIKKRELEKPSNHLGLPGQKMKGYLSVNRVIPIETMYGYVSLVLMTDPDGNKLKWKTNALSDEVRYAGEDDVMEAVFKVKGHDEYKDVKQTAVTHLKVVRWLEQEEEPLPTVEVVDKPKSKTKKSPDMGM